MKALVPIAIALIAISAEAAPNALITSAVRELEASRDCLAAIAAFSVGERASIPACPKSLPSASELFDDHYSEITRHALGEQKHLRHIFANVQSAISVLPRAAAPDDILDWERTNKLTANDAAFVSGFLAWYLRAQIDGRPTDAHFTAGSKAPMHACTLDGKPIVDYAVYLGLID